METQNFKHGGFARLALGSQGSTHSYTHNHTHTHTYTLPVAHSHTHTRTIALKTLTSHLTPLTPLTRSLTHTLSLSLSLCVCLSFVHASTHPQPHSHHSHVESVVLSGARDQTHLTLSRLPTLFFGLCPVRRSPFIILGWLDQNLVASHHLKSWMVENGAREDLITACPICVDTGLFQRNHTAGALLRERMGLPEDEIVILFAARIVAQKQPRLFGDVITTLARCASVFL
jgi:glycosyltransferase involved in cell wall biosynthesis